MKPFLLAIICLFACNVYAQVKFSNLEYKPALPNRGDKLVFTYHPAGTPLMNEKNIDAVVYTYRLGAPSLQEIQLKKVNGKYTASLTVDSNATLIAILFEASGKKDANGQKGYLVPIYSGDKPVPGASLAQGNIYSHTGEPFGIQQQPELTLAYLQKEWDDFPETRMEYIITYFNVLHKVKPAEAPGLLIKELNKMDATEKSTEKEYSILEALYRQYNMQDKAAAIEKEKKTKFPNGLWLSSEKVRSVSTEKDLAKKEQLALQYLQDFKGTDDLQRSRNEFVYSVLLNIKAKQKDWDGFSKLSAQLPPNVKAGLYNDIAWKMAEAGEELQFAKKLSEEATLWAKKEITNPTVKETYMRRAKEAEQGRKYNYSMCADTYAFILYQLKDYKTGLQYAKDAVDIRKRLDPEYNDRYALLLEKTASSKEVKKELEPMVRDGKAGNETKAILRRAILAINPDQAAADRYFAAIETANMERIKKELQKKMVNENAPLFRLVNLDKKEVKLQDLKGKVVIVDFWATWCGPCIASFPGMQKAVNKYKDNPNVVFLFIDTWETGDDREKLVTEFIRSKNYNFNVLYDEMKKENPAEFAVVSSYKVEGIPTKFIIDPDGNIRFKSVGFSGSEDALVQEISTMIEMAAGTKKM